MADFAVVRTGLKTRLETISGLTGYSKPGGTLVLPAALILPRMIEYDETMARGSDLLGFEVLLLVADPTAELAQEELDPYLNGSGASSVKAALESDSSGAISSVDWIRVPRCSQYGEVIYAGKTYLGARFEVEVNVDGS